MIEFTADCGHVIKADKAQAGAIVQCAYCGREAEVPRPADPDFLFEEVDLDELARTEGSTPLGATSTVDPAEKPAAMPSSPRTILAASGTIVGLIVLIAVGYVIVDSASNDQNQPAGETATVPGSHLTGTSAGDHETSPDSGDPAPTTEDARADATRDDPGNAAPDAGTPTVSDPALATAGASGELLAEAQRLARLLGNGIVVDPHAWGRYLVGGGDHATWLLADADSRIALIEVLEPQQATALSHALGSTMLRDDSLDVRIALLQALVEGRAPEGLSFIEQRLDLISRDTRMTDVERQKEESQLQAARRRLSPKPAQRKRNPWER